VASGGVLSLFFAWTSRIQSIATTTMIPGEGWCRAELRLFRLTHFANWPKMSVTLSNASFEAISPHRQSRQGPGQKLRYESWPGQHGVQQGSGGSGQWGAGADRAKSCS